MYMYKDTGKASFIISQLNNIIDKYVLKSLSHKFQLQWIESIRIYAALLERGTTYINAMANSMMIY